MSPIQKFYVASSAPYKTYNQVFTSSGTWTCPVGTTEVEVFAVGGGGGAGGLNYNTSQYYAVTGGGGGGQVTKEVASVVPGTTYNITVGAGGAGGSSSLTGQMGGLSSFNSSYTLVNGILQQPNMDTNYFRYIDTTGTLASPPAYNNTSYSMTTPSYWYSGTTPGIETNSSNGGVTRSVYLGGSAQYKGTYFWVAVKPNTQYTGSAYFATNSATTSTFNVRLEWYTSLYGSFISATDGTSGSNASTWTRYSATGTAPSNATYVLARFQAQGGSVGTYATGFQLEEGSLTAFKSPGFNAPANSRVVQNLGLIIESSNTVMAGGGGGGMTFNPATSGSWFNSTYVVRPEYSGAGVGACYGTGTSSPMIGGNGASYNGSTGVMPYYHISNYTNTNAVMNYLQNYVYFEGVGGGGHAYYNDSNVGYFHVNEPPLGYDGVYGAGGTGGRYSSVSNTFSTSNTSVLDGKNGLSNTGAGGSGLREPSSTGANRNITGGSGGSGVVMLKWMGQA